MKSWDSLTGRECVRFDVLELEHQTSALLLPNGTTVFVPKSEEGQDFAMACARAAVEARAEWARPKEAA